MSFILKSILHIFRLIIFAALLLFTTQGKAQVKAGFSSDVTTGCSPLLVNFKNQSSGTDNTTRYYWDLGNGSGLSQEANPSSLFLNTGSGSVTYTIKLVVKSSNGADSVTRKSYITVYANPKISFKPDVTEGCPPLNVKFTDATKAGSGTIKSWLWDFGEGKLSTEQNPSATFHYSNTYHVSLSVVNSFGCKQTAEGDDYIHVLDTVKAGFNYHYTNICQSPAPIDFQNNSQSASPLAGYSWDFGDGNKSTDVSPSHTFQNNGKYAVKLITKNTAGCSDTSVQTINIGKAGADFNYTKTCVNSPVQFSDASSAVPVSSVWSFGDGTSSTLSSPTHVFTEPGTYNVTLKADFGSCVGSITKKVVIVNRPSASFSASASNVCKLPFAVSFTNNSSGADSYQWMFGDSTTSNKPNALHTYTTEGFFDVKLVATAGSGCTDTAVVKNAVRLGPPVIDSINNLPAKGCVPYTVNPLPVVTSAETIVSYKWDFGDGEKSGIEQPEHIYTKSGVYNVSLIVITAGGCSDTLVMSKAVSVGIAPKAAFGASPLDVCARIPVAFTDSSQGNVTSWLWQFGDGGESTQQNASHHYMDTGWFSVKLVVSNYNCKDTIIKPNLIYIRPPVANYQSSFVCAKPYERVFTDKSRSADTWQWDFGDGTQSSEQNPVHTFPKTGVFVIKLKVTNDQCYDSIQVKMQVVDEHPAFTYNYETKAACRNDVVTFTATNISPANINSYNWIYGDTKQSGFTANAVTNTHKYATSGTFTPQLITKDILGCLDTVVSQTKAVVFGPIAKFGNDTGVCINATAHFSDSSSTDGTHDLQEWNWTYEPNVVQSYVNASSFTHLYTKAGYYDVKLVVYDTYGCKDSVTKTKALQVTQPKAKFIVSDSLKCSNNNLTFTTTSTGEKLTYVWNFGDNTTLASLLPSVNHSYAAEGLYAVSLSVTDKFKCKSDTVKLNAVSITNPKAKMLINGPTESTCPPLLVKPTSQSQYYTKLFWSFGDGGLSGLDTPKHNYIMGGNYDLTLVAKGYGECYDTAHQLIKLKGPSGKMTYTPFVQCKPLSASFSNETKDAVKVIWDFNDGNVESDNANHSTSHVYKNNGKYLPKLLMTDKDGCNVVLENADTIYVKGVNAEYLTTAQPSCDSSLSAFVQTSVPFFDTIQSYRWSFGDGATSTQKNPEHYFANDGMYGVKLSLVTKGGCTDSVTHPVDVLIHHTPMATLIAPASICAQSAVSFHGADTLNEAGSTWLWSFGDNAGDNSNGSTSHTFMQGGLYNVKAIVTTPFGCADTSVRALQVVDLPKTFAGLDSFVCNGSTILLKPGGADKYQWLTDNTLSCTNCATPIAAPTENTSYIVTGWNTFGCKSLDTIALEVIKKQTISTVNDTLCAGENTTLQVSGADLYSWSPALYIDNPASASPRFHAAKDTLIRYTVTGMDKKKCFTDTKDLWVKVYPVPQLDIVEKEIDLNVGFSVQLKTQSSADITQWRWEPQAFLSDARTASPVASPTQSITYSCVATNGGSCFARDQVTIHVMCNNANMFVPNTFSPNGDGMNDRFFPRGTGVFNIKSLRIFNRWGQEVFERTNFLPNRETDGWDGTFKGLPIESDVYVYMLEVICENKSIIPFKGNVTLLR